MSDEGKPDPGRRLLPFLVGMLFFGMALAIVFMAWRNHDLKGTLTKLQEDMTNVRSAGAALKVGEVLEPLELLTLAGETTRVGYDDPSRDTVLLIFSPECPACKDNFDNWKKIETSRASSGGELFYISTEEPERTIDFARDHALALVLVAGKELLARYRVEEIPTTILVGPGGVVKRVWVGLLPADAVSELGAGRS